MRMSTHLAFPLVAIALFACHTSKQASATQHTFGNDRDPVFFSLSRTPCFGRCKAYTITIQRTGEATYLGNSNVDRIGTWKGTVDQATMDKLAERAAEIGFYAMQDTYDANVTDLPSTIVRVNADGNDKKVVGRYKYPPTFKAFAAYADSLLGPVQWTKAKGADD